MSPHKVEDQARYLFVLLVESEVARVEQVNFCIRHVLLERAPRSDERMKSLAPYTTVVGALTFAKACQFPDRPRRWSDNRRARQDLDLALARLCEMRKPALSQLSGL